MRFRTGEDLAHPAGYRKDLSDNEFVVVIRSHVLFGFDIKLVLLVFRLLQFFVIVALSNTPIQTVR